MSLNINKLRSETRGCEHVVHFNNAGASLMADPVVESMISYLEEEACYGGYETAARHKPDIETTYKLIAELINADPEEIALLENATAAWNMAFYAIDFTPGDRILTSVSEYASNYINYLNLKKNKDISIEVIPNDDHGQTDTSALSNMMDDKVKLISITHIPTNNGLVNPAEEIGEIAKNSNALYLLDACQSVGQYPINIENIGCEMLSATGRKYMRAPRGTGFLYVSKKVMDTLHPPFLDLHSAEWIAKDQFKVRNDARKFENWESNYAGIIGLNKAVAHILDLGIHNIWKRIQFLADQFRKRLDTIPGVKVRDIGEVQCGIVTFTVSGKSSEKVKQYLSSHEINVSISTKSSTLLDMESRGLGEAVRASIHYYNTEEEIAKFIERIGEL